MIEYYPVGIGSLLEDSEAGKFSAVCVRASKDRCCSPTLIYLFPWDQVDVKALDSQVEERKLREATEQSKEAAYGKNSRQRASQEG